MIKRSHLIKAGFMCSMMQFFFIFYLLIFLNEVWLFKSSSPSSLSFCFTFYKMEGDLAPLYVLLFSSVLLHFKFAIFNEFSFFASHRSLMRFVPCVCLCVLSVNYFLNPCFYFSNLFFKLFYI